jgi:hypothetical protein
MHKTIDLASFANSTTLKATYGDTSRKNVIKLGPSIVHVKDDVYIIAYRVWIKNLPHTKVPKAPGDVGHPWIHNWHDALFTGTGICLVTIDKDMKIKVIYDGITKSGQSKEDTRLFKTGDGKIIATYNAWDRLDPYKHAYAYDKQNNKLQQRCYHHAMNGKVKYTFPWTNFVKLYGKDAWDNGKSMEKWDNYWHKSCAFMYASELTMSKSGHVFSSKKVICPTTQGAMEKNWAMMDVQGMIFYQYAPDPWKFIRKGSCDVISPKNSDFFKRLRIHIGDFTDGSMGKFKFVRFSNSTPLIPFTSDTHLGVGHYKLKYPSVDAENPKVLKDFMNQIKLDLKVKSMQVLNNVPSDQHRVLRSTDIEDSFDGLFYGWFFYTVNSNTLELDRVSDAYLPRSSKRITLTFPNGLTKHHDNNSYIVSYHEADASVMLKEIPVHDIEAMLVHTNDTHVSKFKFKFDLVQLPKIVIPKIVNPKIVIPKIVNPKIVIPKRPLKVSCILPSYNRESFLPHCLHLLNIQTFTDTFKRKYGNIALELVIVDDTKPSYTTIPKFIGQIAITHVTLMDRHTIGDKRNKAVANATGDIIIHWDDDDWYDKHRIMIQIEPLLNNNADITAFTDFRILNACNGVFYKTSANYLRRHFYDGIQGGTLCYKREYHTSLVQYPNMNIGEDVRFMIKSIKKLKARLLVLKASNHFVYVKHNNTYLFYMDDKWVKTRFALPLVSKQFYQQLAC